MPETTNNVDGQAAIARARAIAAKLFGAVDGVAFSAGDAVPTTTAAASATTTSKPKRKRWATDESAAVTETSTTTYKSMELPSDIFASVTASVGTSAGKFANISSSSTTSATTTATGKDPWEEQEEAPKKKSTYSPKPVAQILGLVPADRPTGTGATHPSTYGPAGGATSTALVEASSSSSSAPHLEEHIYCPNGIVGFIIGRGGESIASMQRRTGCAVQIQKEYEMIAEGKKERKITLISTDITAIHACRTIIEDMIAERTRQLGGGMSSTGGVAGSNKNDGEKLRLALAAGHALVHVPVPHEHVGLVIGKAGMNIKDIQDRTGAHIQIPSAPDDSNPLIRTCSVTCATMEGALCAKRMIEEILEKNVKLQQQQRGGFGGPGLGSAGVGGADGMGAGSHSISVAVS